MNIQMVTGAPPAAGPAATGAGPVPGASGPREAAAAPAVATPVPAQAPLSSAAVEQVARQINDFLESSSSSLRFMVDPDLRKVVVRVVDTQTDEVIRQIPSEEMVAISRSVDQLRGLLIKQKT